MEQGYEKATKGIKEVSEQHLSNNLIVKLALKNVSSSSFDCVNNFAFNYSNVDERDLLIKD